MRAIVQPRCESRRRDNRRQTGYSLLELMVVLAIITTITTLSWPALMRPWSKSQVQQAAIEWSRELSRARAHAIETSRVLEVRWRPGQGQFEFRSLPIESQGPSVSDTNVSPVIERHPSVADDPSSRLPASAQANVPVIRDYAVANQLLLDVVFRNDNAMARDESSRLEGQRLAVELQGGDDSLHAPEMQAGESMRTDLAERFGEQTDGYDWSSPVRFYPDGRTDQAHWVLVSPDGYECDVTLRSLTGLPLVGPARRTWNESTNLEATDAAEPLPTENLEEPDHREATRQ